MLAKSSFFAAAFCSTRTFLTVSPLMVMFRISVALSRHAPSAEEFFLPVLLRVVAARKTRRARARRNFFHEGTSADILVSEATTFCLCYVVDGPNISRR